jgi:hypothetical protein
MNHIDPSISSGSSPGFGVAKDLPGSTLTAIQKYLLRVALGQAGETVFHRGRIVEIVDTHDSLRLLMPLVESDLSEGNYNQTFWAPTRPAERKRLNLERRNMSRRNLSIGVSPGEGRPHGARRVRLRTRFPSVGYLTHLVRALGYDSSAAFAAMVQAHQPWLRTVDRRQNGSGFVSMKHPYHPAAPVRRTKVGGGLTKQQVQAGLQKMRTDNTTKAALIEIVYRRRSTLEVSNESGVPFKNLYVYASRLRARIEKDQAALAGLEDSRIQENLS